MAPAPQFASSAKSASDVSKQSAEKRLIKEQESVAVASAKHANAQAEKVAAETQLIPNMLLQQAEDLRIKRAQAAKEEATMPIYEGAGGISKMIMDGGFTRSLISGAVNSAKDNTGRIGSAVGKGAADWFDKFKRVPSRKIKRGYQRGNK